MIGKLTSRIPFAIDRQPISLGDTVKSNPGMRVDVTGEVCAIWADSSGSLWLLLKVDRTGVDGEPQYEACASVGCAHVKFAAVQE